MVIRVFLCFDVFPYSVLTIQGGVIAYMDRQLYQNRYDYTFLTEADNDYPGYQCTFSAVALFE